LSAHYWQKFLVIDPAKMAVLTSLELPDSRPVAGFRNSDIRLNKIVITGFNTDIEHEGVVYHVQTEDKGLDSPLILSLVYSGGAILASKRSRYEDLIAAGFDEEVLAQRLKRQHRLICAAINAGRLEELKRMGSARDEATAAVVPVGALDGDAAVGESVAAEKPRSKRSARAKEAREAKAAGESAYTVYDPRRQAPASEAAAAENGPVLSVLDEDEFHAGRPFTIRVLVEGRTGNKQKPLSGVAVSIKILGTMFRPQIYSVKTQRDGVAIVDTTMPHFTSGRAAVLIRAVVKDETVELRRVIHPAA
jgi:hypothetical protein